MALRGALTTFSRRARPAASTTTAWMNPAQGALLPQQPPRLLSSKPTPESVAHFVNEYCEMNNEQLFILASDGDSGARKERLIREVMAVDEIEWDEAAGKVEEINKTNNQGLFFVTLPQRMFILAATGTGLATFPLCFDLNTAMAFNDLCVTADVAEPEDLETMLEVGTWTWNWMEPPLGQACFFILCLDFARAQLNNLGRKPYVENLIENRAERLSRSFPQYHKRIVEEFATSKGLKAT